jgi:DNA-binding beta-propeller fold protein YncE
MSQHPLLAVSTNTGLHLDLFDAVTLERMTRIGGLVEQPHEIAWDAGRRLMYLTHTYRRGGYGEGQPAGHEISVIDPDAGKVTDVIDIAPYLGPHDIEYDPQRDLIFTGVEDREGHNGIVIVDAKTRTVAGNIPLPERNAHWLALTPDGRLCFAAHKEAETVSVVDLDTRTVVASIPCPGGAEEVDCSPDSRFAYVASPIMNVTVNVTQGALNRNPPSPDDPAPRVLKIDTSTLQVAGTLTFDEIVCALRVAPNGDLLVSEMHFPDPAAADPDPVPGMVAVVDTATMQVRSVYPAGELPFTIRFSGDGQTAYAANLKSGTVTVLDLTAGQVTATLDNNTGVMLGGTHGLCWIPAGPRL